MIRTALRSWGMCALALLAASAGMSALSTGSAVQSLGRMAFAAGVLSAYAAFAGLLFTRRAERTRWHCLLWGGTVPVLVGVITAILVAGTADPITAVLSGLPWLTGVALSGLLGPTVPEVRRPRWLDFRRSTGA